jgi:hypothetical protein
MYRINTCPDKGKTSLSFFNCNLNKKRYTHIHNFQTYNFGNLFSDEQFNYMPPECLPVNFIADVTFYSYYNLQRTKKDYEYLESCN